MQTPILFGLTMRFCARTSFFDHRSHQKHHAQRKITHRPLLTASFLLHSNMKKIDHLGDHDFLKLEGLRIPEQVSELFQPYGFLRYRRFKYMHNFPLQNAYNFFVRHPINFLMKSKNAQHHQICLISGFWQKKIHTFLQTAINLTFWLRMSVMHDLRSGDMTKFSKYLFKPSEYCPNSEKYYSIHFRTHIGLIYYIDLFN